MGAGFEPTDATGFIRLMGLPMKVAGLVDAPKTRKPKKKK
jgi:hypothetical protein